MSEEQKQRLTCQKCKQESDVLYKVNAIDEAPGQFWCFECCEAEEKELDKGITELTKVILGHEF